MRGGATGLFSFSSNISRSRCGRLVGPRQQQQQQQQGWNNSSNRNPTTTTRFLLHTPAASPQRPETSQHLVSRREISLQVQQRLLSSRRIESTISTTTNATFTTKRYLSSSSSIPVSNHRSLSSSSSAVAVVRVDEEEEDIDEENTTHHSSFAEEQQEQLVRPRLQALKQRLLDEKMTNSSSSSRSGLLLDDATVSRKQNNNNNSSNNSTTTPPPIVQVEHHVTNRHPQHEEDSATSPSPSSSSLLHPITKSTDLETMDTMDLLRRLEEMEETTAASTTRVNNNTTDQALHDSFGRKHDYLRISLTERCNLRCTYCMPEAGVPLQPAEHLLQTPELLQLASHFYHHLGVNKFRLTGGEPTLRKDLIQVVQGLSSLYNNNSSNNDSSTRGRGKPQIGMTTNGIVLAKHLPALYEAGLTSVNVSLDTLDADKFAALTRRPAAYLDRVLEVIEVLTTQEPYKSNISTKINCVVQRHVNDNELVDFVKHFCHDNSNSSTRHLNAIRFIEYMPFTENGWDLKKLVPHQEMLQILQQQLPQDGTSSSSSIQALAATDPHDTTKWYTSSGSSNSNSSGDGRSTTKIGFITSMSNHFCAGCNRLRLTADGQLQVCLFGTNGRNGRVSLRDALRATTLDGGPGVSPRQLNLLINYALSRKHYKLGGHDSPTDIMQRAGTNNRPMTLIGG